MVTFGGWVQLPYCPVYEGIIVNRLLKRRGKEMVFDLYSLMFGSITFFIVGGFFFHLNNAE